MKACKQIVQVQEGWQVNVQDTCKVENKVISQKIMNRCYIDFEKGVPIVINCIKAIESINFLTSNFQHLVYWLS